MKVLITALFYFTSLHSSAQDAKEILQKTYNKCQTIQNGYYEMTTYYKFYDSKDTLKGSSNCHFKKLEKDDLNLPAFRIGDDIFMGNELVTTQPWDSTATIMSKALWAKNIENQSRSYKLFAPFTSKKMSIIQHDSDFIDKRYIFKFIGEETLNNEICYHIQVNDTNKYEHPGTKFIKIEYNYLIKKSDFIPIQYSIALDNGAYNDTTHQYDKYILDKYEINNLIEGNLFSLNSLPNYYKLIDYSPSESRLLLSNNTNAPSWELLSLTDKKTNLKDFKGQLVLVDFFTKPCYPCMLALPGLQALHEKYKKKGLKVIGIDTYDKKEDGIVAYLSKRGVTYPVLLGGHDVANDYHVSGIPTVYLIDKHGKIIFSDVGYIKGQEEVLERIIKKNL